MRGACAPMVGRVSMDLTLVDVTEVAGAQVGDEVILIGASGGPLAEMYVVAHEWGHHIQNIGGIIEQHMSRQTGPASDSVRTELQADCFAGGWAGAASTTKDGKGRTFLEPITDAQIADALNAAAAVGDDRIQQAATGRVDPEGWTHGSAEQRQRWFTTGFRQGAGACDTFSVPAAQL